VFARWLLPLTLVATSPGVGSAFSVLAHQGVVDESWERVLVPSLRARFPKVSERELGEARAFAYGGSHLADLGYFPLGNRLFSDLLHYVRAGDFVNALATDASTPQEYAFALGALAHYEADRIGHPEATNRAVAVMYPKLAKEHGERVTYADSPSAHLETEFRFDILQVARRAEIPGLFEHAMDFQVPRALLERVFRKVYGLELDDLFTSYEVALGTYRWGFRTLLEEATGIAWELYRGDIASLEPTATAQTFVFRLSRADFEKEFGRIFMEPGYFFRFVSLFGNLLPNVGPLKRMPYKPLPPEVQLLYADGFHRAVVAYQATVANGGSRGLRLANVDLDTGRATRPGEYELADKAYAELLQRLAREHFAKLPSGLGKDLLAYYRDIDTGTPGLDADDKRDAISALAQLHSVMSGKRPG
jgi:zinc dependent phospholipase C